MSEVEVYETRVKDTPLDTDETVWSKTLGEVERGRLQGPFDPKQIPSHYPRSHSVGVVQGKKTRCVGDFFARSHVNAWVQVAAQAAYHRCVGPSDDAGDDSGQWVGELVC